MNEPHELDELARQAAIEKYCSNAEGAVDFDDVELSADLISFEGGLTLEGSEARVTVWELDESYLVVFSQAVGEGDPAHSVLEINP